MTPFKHILVPTDFGEPAERALDLALGLASQFESKVTLLHASWLPPLAYAGYEGLSWPIDEMMAAAQKELDAALAKAKNALPENRRAHYHQRAFADHSRGRQGSGRGSHRHGDARSARALARASWERRGKGRSTLA